MPIYGNPTDKPFLIGMDRIEAGETKAFNYYLPPQIASELILAFQTPPVKSPVLFAKQAEDETIAVPYSAEKLEISVLALIGSAVYFADDADGIPLPAGASYTITSAPWERIGSVRVSGVAVVVVRELI